MASVLKRSTFLSTYNDDFNEDNNFLRILFNPARSLQSREVTQIQSLLQEQIKKNSDISLSDGSIITGGGVSADTSVTALLLETDFAGSAIDVASLKNNVITGLTSGVTDQARAYVIETISRGNRGAIGSGGNFHVLLIKYLSNRTFGDGVSISIENSVSVATSVSITGNSLTQAASRNVVSVTIDEGIYYISGFYTHVPKQIILVSPQTIPTTGSVLDKAYRVGINIDEQFIAFNSTTTLGSLVLGSTLVDPASGTPNEKAPGADRYRQVGALSIRNIIEEATTDDVSGVDDNTDNFIELFRIDTNLNISGSTKPVLPDYVFDTFSSGYIRPNVGVSVTLAGQSAITAQTDIDMTLYFLPGEIIKTGHEDYRGDGTITTYANGLVIGTGTQFVLPSNSKVPITNADKITIQGINYNVGAVVSDTVLFLTGTIPAYTNTSFRRVGSEYTVDVVSADRVRTSTSLSTRGSAQIYNFSRVTAVVDPSTVIDDRIYKNNFSNFLDIKKNNTSETYSGQVIAVPKTNYFVTRFDNTQYVADASTFTPIASYSPLYTTVASNNDNDISRIGDSEVHLYTSAQERDVLGYVGLIGRARILSVEFNDTQWRDNNDAELRTYIWGFEPNENTEFSVAVLPVSQNTITLTIPPIPNTSQGEQAGLVDSLVGVNVTFTSGINTAFNIDATRTIISSNNISSGQTQIVLDRAFSYDIEVGDRIRLEHSLKNTKTLIFLEGSGGTTFGRGTVVDSTNITEISSTSKFIYPLPKTGITTAAVNDYTRQTVRSTVPFNLDSLTDALPIGYNDNDLDSIKSHLIGFQTNNTGFISYTSTVDSLTTRTIAGQPNVTRVIGLIRDAATGQKTKVLSSETVSTINNVQSILGTQTTKTNVNYTHNLSHFDIYDILGIFVGTPATYAAAIAGNMLNITDKFVLDNGQRDDRYVLGSLRAVGDFTDVTGSQSITIFYRFFSTPTTSGYFSVDSYLYADSTKIAREDIPSYGTTTGKTYHLADVIDYRPVASGTTYDTTNIPVPGSSFTYTYSAQVPRQDIIVVDSSEQYRVISGDESTNPIEMVTKASEHKVFTVDVKPDNIQIISNSTTTRDKSANVQKPLSDSDGNTVELAGYFVDAFDGSGYSDIDNPDFSVSIDPEKQIIRPSFNVQPLALVPEIFNGTVNNKGVVTLGFTETEGIKQPFKNTVVNPNKFGLNQWIGQLDVLERFDNWYDDSELPLVAFDQNDEGALWNRSFSKWNNWKTDFIGSSTPFTKSGLTLDSKENSIYKNKEINYWLKDQNIYFHAKGLKPFTPVYVTLDGINLNEYFTRAIELSISTGRDVIPVGSLIKLDRVIGNDDEGILLSKYSTRTGIATYYIYPFVGDFSNIQPADRLDQVGGSNESIDGPFISQVTTLTGALTDAVGELAGVVKIPKREFTLGTKILKITDSFNETQETTFAETVFQGGLNVQVEDNTRENATTQLELGKREIFFNQNERTNVTGKWKRTFSQKIFIDPTLYPEGLFVASLDLFFQALDTTLPIKVYLKPLDIDGNPHPTEILAGSKVHRRGSDLVEGIAANISAGAGGISSLAIAGNNNFAFDYPIYLKPKTGYAIVIDTDSPVFQLHAATVGDLNIQTSATSHQSVIRKTQLNSFIDGLYYDNNFGEWKNDQETMLMFVLNRCEFVSSGSVNFSPAASSTFDILNLAATESVRSDLTDISYQYEVNGTSRNINTNENTILNTPGVNAVVNLSATLASRNTAISPVIDASKSTLLTINNIINNAPLNTLYIQGGTSVSNPGTGSAVITSKQGSGASVFFGFDGSSVNAITTTVSGGSGYIGDFDITFGTGEFVDAFYSAYTELDPTGGTTSAKYISKPVTTYDNKDASDLTVILSGNRPIDTNIFVYYRAKNSIESEDINNKGWNLMYLTKDQLNKFTTTNDELIEYRYQVSNFVVKNLQKVTSTYTTIQFKVVFTSSSSATIPFVNKVEAFMHN